MPDSNARKRPVYTKGTDGSWHTRYRSHDLAAVKNVPAESPGARYCAYVISSQWGALRADGPSRDHAVRALMEKIDAREEGDAQASGAPATVLPVQRTAQGGPEAQEVLVGEVTAKGTLPRHLDDAATVAALAALGPLPTGGPGLRLAEVSDSFDLTDPFTHPAAAWGALILPASERPGPVHGYWLESGRAERPKDAVAQVRIQAIADRLADAGFGIESVSRSRVTALQVKGREDAKAVWMKSATEEAELTDTWVLKTPGRVHLALVEGRSDSVVMDIARELDPVRASLRDLGGVWRRRLYEGELERLGREADGIVSVVVHHCEERGHADCGMGIVLSRQERDPDSETLSAPEPDEPVQEHGRPLEPTFPKGATVFTDDGSVYTVWETVERLWDGETVEMVITTGGRELRAASLRRYEGGERMVETGAHKGDTLTERLRAVEEAARVSARAHSVVVRAAKELESFRTCRNEERAGHLREAENDLRWAAATFASAFPGLPVELWTIVTASAVEMVAQQDRARRVHDFDAVGPHTSPFGVGSRSLAWFSTAGWGKVRAAAGSWGPMMAGDLMARATVERALDYAAHQFADQLHHGFEAWRAPLAYLAGLLHSIEQTNA